MRAIERAEIRARRAEIRAAQAKSRAESAETRAEQAESRTDSAKTRTEHAETRTEHAETRAEHAETRAEQAEAIVKTTTRTAAGHPPAKAEASNAHPDRRALEQLTLRQREILQLIAAGQNTKQMAAHLHISPKTVEYHRLKLMNALKVHDIPGLVRFALRIGLGPSDD